MHLNNEAGYYLTFTKKKDEEEKLETVLDELNDISGRLDKLQETVEAIPAGQPTTLKPGNCGITKEYILEACEKAVRTFLEEQHTILTTAFKDDVLECMKKTMMEVYEDHRKKQHQLLDEREARREAELKEYAAKRTGQGVRTMDQFAEWAPEYPLPVQMWMRCMVTNIFNADTRKEDIQACAKLVGDLLVAGTRQPEPTFRGAFRCKWKKFKGFVHKKPLLRYFILAGLAVCSVVFLYSYQMRVMRIDETNRVYDMTVIRTKKDAQLWNELDSVLHTEGSYYDRLFKWQR